MIRSVLLTHEDKCGEKISSIHTVGTFNASTNSYPKEVGHIWWSMAFPWHYKTIFNMDVNNLQLLREISMPQQVIIQGRSALGSDPWLSTHSKRRIRTTKLHSLLWEISMSTQVAIQGKPALSNDLRRSPDSGRQLQLQLSFIVWRISTPAQVVIQGRSALCNDPWASSVSSVHQRNHTCIKGWRSNNLPWIGMR